MRVPRRGPAPICDNERGEGLRQITKSSDYEWVGRDPASVGTVKVSQTPGVI